MGGGAGGGEGELLLSIPFSFFSGLLAAGSPCVVVLVPLILFRFRGNLDRQLIFFVGGFLMSYICLAMAANQILSSFLQEGFKMGLGAAFTLAGVMAINGRLNPIELPLKQNSFLVGMGFALLVSVNPCTIPFLALILSLQPSHALSSLLCYGVGMLTPSLLFLLAGKAALKIFTRYGETLSLVNKVMNWTLCCSGIYLISSAVTLSEYDLLLAAVLLTLALGIVLKALDYPPRRLQLLALLLFALALLAFLQTKASHSTLAHQLTSQESSSSSSSTTTTTSSDTSSTPPPSLKCIDPELLFCQACQHFIVMFGILVLLTSATIFIHENEALSSKVPPFLKRALFHLLFRPASATTMALNGGGDDKERRSKLMMMDASSSSSSSLRRSFQEDWLKRVSTLQQVLPTTMDSTPSLEHPRLRS